MTDIIATRWPAVERTPRAPAKARIARAIIRPAIDRINVRLSLADGTLWGNAGPNAPEMHIVRPKAFFSRLGHDSKIGFGEAYMAGDWTAGPGTDLADLLTPFAERLAHLIPKPLQRLRGLVDERLPRHERNSIDGARSNIQRHYDLSNELFAEFLDPSLSYSSAFFGEGDDLEAAQLRKIDSILDRAGVGAGTRLLEIGSGWGTLAIRAAERGAAVTTITISAEQAALARERFAAAGVDVDLQLIDYREVTGSFDAIVSVEMIEAVGEEFWSTYFQKIDSLLAPGGRVVIQSILMAHHRYLATRDSYGWIQKYIFPGGLIPSIEAIDNTLATHTGLQVTDNLDLGQHYAKTLHLWRDNFNARWETIRQQGFDETFRRMWEFYLAYCEAGFRTGYLGVSQLTMTRAEANHG